MKNLITLICLIVLIISCGKNSGSLLDKAEKNKPYVNKKTIFSLILVYSICFYTKDNEKFEISPKAATINYHDNRIHILDRYQKAIISFNLDRFSDNQPCVSFIEKNKGKGPNEFNMPNDIIYDKTRDLYYISDLLNYCIYIYNSEFSEIDRIKLPIRPFKISLSKEFLFITPYFSLPIKNKIIEVVNLKTRKLEEGILASSETGTDLEKNFKNNVLIAPINYSDNDYFITKSYPNFNIYRLKNNQIIKTFTAPDLRNKIISRPSYIYKNNDRKVWGLNAFVDIIYDNDKKMLFVLTTSGWAELAEKLNIDRNILVFDQEGNLLCEHKIRPYGGGENNICFDSKNNVLYYLASSYIKKFKLLKK